MREKAAKPVEVPYDILKWSRHGALYNKTSNDFQLSREDREAAQRQREIDLEHRAEVHEFSRASSIFNGKEFYERQSTTHAAYTPDISAHAELARTHKPDLKTMIPNLSKHLRVKEDSLPTKSLTSETYKRFTKDQLEPNTFDARHLYETRVILGDEDVTTDTYTSANQATYVKPPADRDIAVSVKPSNKSKLKGISLKSYNQDQETPRQSRLHEDFPPPPKDARPAVGQVTGKNASHFSLGHAPATLSTTYRDAYNDDSGPAPLHHDIPFKYLTRQL